MLVLPFLAVAFLLGLLCGAYIPYFPLTLAGSVLAIVVGMSILERRNLLDPQRAVSLCLCLLFGVLYWSLVVLSPAVSKSVPESPDKLDGTFMGRVVAPVQQGAGRQTMILEADEGSLVSRRIRLVWREQGSSVYHGDRIQFHGTIHRPRASLNPGGFDYAAYLDRQGIEWTGTVSGKDAIQVLELGEQSVYWSLWSRIDHWRARIRSGASHTLNQPALGMFLGMIIGDRGYLDRELQEWFFLTGTIHLLSISGSHLGLVAVMVFWLVKRLLLLLPHLQLLALSRVMTPSRVAVLFTWPVVVLYALLAGAEVATIRSLVMVTLGLVAFWLGYERHLWHAMAVALFVIVLYDPRAMFDLSFQLSFLSTSVMVYMILWLTAWEGHEGQPGGAFKIPMIRYGLHALVTSGAITLVTFPVVAFYFNQFPWLGIVTNVLAVPLTGFILVPLGLFAAGWTVVGDGDSLILGSWLERLFDGMAHALRWCSGFPGGEWHVAAPSLLTLVLFYLGLCVAIVRVAPRSIRIVGGSLAIVLVCWWLISPRSIGDGDRWRVTFLDVGQGDSALLELPDGQTVLIDGGTRYERFDMGRGVVGPFIWNQGIRRLAHVIGTHPQLDHIGGLIWVLRHIPVGQYWGSGIDRPEPFAQELNAALYERNLEEQLVVRGKNMLESGPCQLIPINTVEGAVAPQGRQVQSGSWLNNHSIVVRLQCGMHSILFTADLETDGLSRLGPEGREPVTVLKVPHHGAKSSFDGNWLRDIHPTYAVVSAGRANSYGHPAESVLQGYQEQQIPLYRTDRDGAVWVTGRLSTSELTVHSMQETIVRPVDISNCLWRCEQDNWRRVWLQYTR